MKKLAISTFFCVVCLFPLSSQNVAINSTGSTANSSAMLDVSSGNTGVLIPRVALLSTANASPVTSPATSLIVYNTATVSDVTPGFYYWNGVNWQRFATGVITGDNWGTQIVTTIGLPFYGNGTSGSPLGMNQSNTSQNGWLSLTDWNNFNNKVSGTGTATRVAFWSATNTISSNANLYWDNTNNRLGVGTGTPGTALDVSGVGRFGLATNGNTSIGNDGNAYIEMRESDASGTPYIDMSNDASSDYDARIMLTANNNLSFLTSTNGQQTTIHSEGLALSGTNKYVNFNTTFGTAGYGFRDNAGVLEYKHNGGVWSPFAQPPTIPGNTEWWVRPTAALYIQPMYNVNARVYDAGQTWAYYYDGNNSKGSFFAGGTVGAVMHRAGVASTEAPSFIWDSYPFIDINNDADITSADQVTYSGGYAFGDAYNGLTGIGRLDAGLRGIGLGNTSGTNSSWPVVGVIGEVVATGTSYNGQQGIYGWQAAPAGAAPTCSGVIGRTSQTGNQSAGVTGYYTNTVGSLTTCFSAYQSIGLVGGATYGVSGQTNVVGGLGVFGVNTELTSSSSVGVQGQVGNSTSVSVDFKGVVGISTNTNNVYGYGGYFQGEWYGVYGYNPTTSSGYGVYYSGNLAGSGTKSCIMKTSQGPRALYCVESPENYFEDYGTASMTNGRAVINIDPLFMETITTDNNNPYKVFIQVTDEIQNQVHIIKHDTYFEVVENNNGTSNAAFDWRLVAKRKGFENLRLAEAPEAYTDPSLYPDPNDPAIPARWREKVLSNYNFLEKVNDNSRIQKHETGTTSTIDKNALEKSNRGNK